MVAAPTISPPPLVPSTWRFSAAPPLDAKRFDELRRAAALAFCKWDPQVGDVSTLAPFPLVISRACWAELGDLAVRLAAELEAAQCELLQRPRLHRQLAISWRIRRALRQAHLALPSPHLLRFDFHWTTHGWRISEVNSDVPGGFTESSSFPLLMAQHFPELITLGDVAEAWAAALVARAEGRPIALVSAAGFMEDHQITHYLAMRIRQGGGVAYAVTGRQIQWRDGRAMINDIEAGLVLRFFQAEWLPSLGWRSGWQNYVMSAKTPISNPGHSILTESKRFPLVWDQLRTALPTWRALLPQTFDPRQIDWRKSDEWILKTALCNNGDSVGIPGAPLWAKMRRDARFFPSHWVVQRRFEILLIATPLGAMYPCLGVYVLDRKVLGIYGRISRQPVIDHSAIDVAVLREKRP